MSLVRGLRLINAIEGGSVDATQLQTLLADPGRRGEFAALVNMRGQRRRMLSSATATAAISGSALAKECFSKLGREALLDLHQSPYANESTLIDTLTWSVQPVPTPFNYAVSSMTYGNGRFVVLSASGDLAYMSIDGRSWTQSTLPKANGWGGLVWTGVYFCAKSGTDITVALSKDGVVWTTSASTSYSFKETASNNLGLVVAVSSENSSYSSLSRNFGVNWTNVNLPTGATWRSVVYGNGVFMASCEDLSSLNAISIDGNTWLNKPLPGNFSVSKTAFGSGLFVIVSNTKTTYYTSPDGITWTARTLPETLHFGALIYGNGLFIALSAAGNINKVLTSADGINWKVGEVPGLSYSAASFGNGVFVGGSSSAWVTSI